MTSGAPITVAYFSDGYSFRNTLAFLRQTCTEANFVFTKKGITIEQSDADNVILVRIELKASELADYQYYAVDEEEKEVPAIKVGFNTVEMMKSTKMVGKKDGIYLITKHHDYNIYVRIVRAGSKTGEGAGMGIVPIRDVDYEGYEEIAYLRSEDDPNTKASSSEFSKMCSNMYLLKCTYVDALGFPSGIIFQGIESGRIRQMEHFGRYDVSEDSEGPHDKSSVLGSLESLSLGSISLPSTPPPKLVISPSGQTSRVRIKMRTIRAMTKFNNLSPMGVIKFYMEKEKPLKIVSNIGTYGTLTVYLRNVKE